MKGFSFINLSSNKNKYKHIELCELTYFNIINIKNVSLVILILD